MHACFILVKGSDGFWVNFLLGKKKFFLRENFGGFDRTLEPPLRTPLIRVLSVTIKVLEMLDLSAKLFRVFA